MATPETRTSQGEAAGLRPAEAEKSARRFITAGWWVQRVKEMSWFGRFNLAILVLAALNATVILISDDLGWNTLPPICMVIHYVLVSTWFVGSLAFLMLLAVKRFFISSRTQPTADASDSAGHDKVR